MRSFILALLVVAIITGCGGSSASSDGTPATPPKSMIADERADDGKGVGEIKSVTLNDPLNATMVARGQSIYDMKCSACHQLSTQRIVGPGFKDVTTRRTPEWIMNMITNVEVMLEEDAAAQALLEECLTRMPNQNVSIGDARDILEFFYANDGKMVGK